MFDVKEIRKDFPMITNHPDLIYFDSGATSYKPQCVIDEVRNYYEFDNANIHRGDYDISFKVSKIYDDTRKTVAGFINAPRKECIVYTYGATSSLNTVAINAGNKLLKKGDVILTSEVEHASDILPWFIAAEKSGAQIRYIPFNEHALMDLKDYEECFKDGKVKIVALPYVSNVMGYIYPIREICMIAHKYGALVSIDGAQGVPHLKIDVQDFDIDFLSFSSHKMLGPAGIGVLYGKYDLLEQMDPIFYGGGSNARFYEDGRIILQKTPEKFEAGTPCIEGVLGLRKAIEYLESIGMDNVMEYGIELSEYFIEKLEKLDNVEIYNKGSQSGIVTFNIKGIFAQDAASYFNKMGISVRTGNHCAKLLQNVIHVNETIRASLYIYNTKEEIDRFIDVIKDTTIEKCVDSVL
ncbi:MAG: aminotransferase class V-fold PLP-dependent enzyme [Erysipelotrichaceae bacterium]|nr:aminotransferase class V-fold PLP-dependent enzyme [Erysipelotrichaceae bacterium]